MSKPTPNTKPSSSAPAADAPNNAPPAAGEPATPPAAADADATPAPGARKPGKKRVLATATREGKTVRVLTDDVRVWKESA